MTEGDCMAWSIYQPNRANMSSRVRTKAGRTPFAFSETGTAATATLLGIVANALPHFRQNWESSEDSLPHFGQNIAARRLQLSHEALTFRGRILRRKVYQIPLRLLYAFLTLPVRQPYVAPPKSRCDSAHFGAISSSLSRWPWSLKSGEPFLPDGLFRHDFPLRMHFVPFRFAGACSM